MINSADPRLHRDLSFGQFVIAFSVYHDLICSVYPDKREELDSYLALIRDLNLNYGRDIFYLNHIAFSSKATLYIAQSNMHLNWSVLDTELLVMIAGGTHAISCITCENSGSLLPHSAVTASYPSGPTSVTSAAAPSAQGTDSHDMTVDMCFTSIICQSAIISMKMFVHTPTVCFSTSASVAKTLTPGQSALGAPFHPGASHGKSTVMV